MRLNYQEISPAHTTTASWQSWSWWKMQKNPVSPGLHYSAAAAESLSLLLSKWQEVVNIISRTLSARAWGMCMFWVSSFCNMQWKDEVGINAVCQFIISKLIKLLCVSKLFSKYESLWFSSFNTLYHSAFQKKPFNNKTLL